MEFIGADVPVYFGSRFQGYVDEYDARVMLSRGEAKLHRSESAASRRLVCKSEEAATKARALSIRDSMGGQSSPTYRESLYSGSKRDHNVIVTGYCVTLKKLVRHNNGQEELVPFKEREGFRRSRFNPDHLPQPIVPVVRNQALAAAWQ